MTPMTMETMESISARSDDFASLIAERVEAEGYAIVADVLDADTCALLIDEVDRIERDEGSRAWRVHIGSALLDADMLVLACPSHASAELLRTLDPDLAQDLSRLRYASCATVNMIYRRSDFRQVPHGFGFFAQPAQSDPEHDTSHR